MVKTREAVDAFLNRLPYDGERHRNGGVVYDAKLGWKRAKAKRFCDGVNKSHTFLDYEDFGARKTINSSEKKLGLKRLATASRITIR